jgi:lipoprotein-anchoring transpeptidase ErfK/SrfK
MCTDDNVMHSPIKIAFGLTIFALVLSACQSAPAIPATSTATPSPVPTDTVVPTLTNTVVPTLTPEPAWYQPIDPSLGQLKYHYALVNSDKARVYTSLDDASASTGNFGYLPNYPAYVAYTTSKAVDEHTYYLTNYGWMKGDDLQELTPSTFSGIQVTRDISFSFGWVLAETQSVNSAGEIVQTYQRYQVVHTVPAAVKKPGFVAIGADEWLPEKSVAVVDPGVPQDAGQICRFIYVSLARQTLSVYNGCKLVFATLISSGKNSYTFEGRFAILYKVAYSSITPPAGSTSDYYIEGVPYFMTYSGNFGFHGAYWHDSFGSPASHGCINLAPGDAKWLYDWAFLGDYVFISNN